jgi:hypothetical protein
MATANLGLGHYQVEFIDLVAELMQKEKFFLKQFDSQAISNTAWAISKIVSDQDSFSAVQNSQDDNPSTFKSKLLINRSAWTIIRSIATEVLERKADEFNAQALSSIAWAFATVDSKDTVLLQVATQHIIDKSMQSLHQFNSQDASNLVWAIAQLYEKKNKSINLLLHGIGKRLLSGSLIIQPLGISTTMWSFAKLKFVNDNIYKGLASRLNTNNASLFSAQNFSNIMWALASAGMTVHIKTDSNIDSLDKKHRTIDEAVLIDPVLQCCTITAREFMKRPHEFNAQSIDNICWSFATLGVKDVQFLNMVEEVVQSRISEFQKGRSNAMTAFTGQEIANILWYAIPLSLGSIGYNMAHTFNSIFYFHFVIQVICNPKLC